MIIEGILFLFLIKTIYCDPHLNSLVEVVQMRGHNMFPCRTNKNCL